MLTLSATLFFLLQKKDVITDTFHCVLKVNKLKSSFCAFCAIREPFCDYEVRNSRKQGEMDSWGAEKGKRLLFS